MVINRRKMLNLTVGSGLSLALSPVSSALDMQDKPIITRSIPSSKENLPVIGMGTWQTFDAGTNNNEREPLRQVLKIFTEKGGKVIDSSPMYGRSEKVVGDLTTDMGIKEQLFIATKVWTSGETAGKNKMAESMRLLRTPVIDLMQVHNLVDYNTHIKTLRKMKEHRNIRYIGITHYTVNSQHALGDILKTDKIDFVQFNYSIATRDAENYLLPLAADQKVATIINQPFESGRLFSAVKGKDLPLWASDFDCKSWGCFFLKYIVSHPAVTCAIPATSKPNHMTDNMDAAYGKLPDEQTRRKMVQYFENL